MKVEIVHKFLHLVQYLTELCNLILTRGQATNQCVHVYLLSMVECLISLQQRVTMTTGNHGNGQAQKGLRPVGVVMQEITRLSRLTSLMYSCTSIFSPATSGLMGSFSFIYKKSNQKNPKSIVTIKTFIDNKSHSFC